MSTFHYIVVLKWKLQVIPERTRKAFNPFFKGPMANFYFQPSHNSIDFQFIQKIFPDILSHDSREGKQTRIYSKYTKNYMKFHLAFHWSTLHSYIHFTLLYKGFTYLCHLPMSFFFPLALNLKKFLRKPISQ